MISPADETMVRSLLERAAQQVPPAPVPIGRVAVRARRIRTVRRTVRGGVVAGVLATAGLLFLPVLNGGSAAPGEVQPAAGGAPPAGLPWVVILAPAGVLLLIAAVFVLIVVGVPAVARRFARGPAGNRFAADRSVPGGLARLWRPARPGPVRWAAAAVVAVFVGGLVTGLTLRVIVLPSESMADTLRAGDRLLVTTVRPGLLPLRRGDVIVFRDPGGWLSPEGTGTDPGYLVKRVIGLPGDRVACCDAAGRITVNGVALDERYVPAGDLPSAEPFSVVVVPGGLWVLGDHRSASWDSRYHADVRDGQVPVAGVVGTVVMVVWPSSRLGIRAGPGDAFAHVP